MEFEKQTENFKFIVEDPEEVEKNDLKARIHSKPVGSDEQFYEERIKLSSHSASTYANTAADIFELDDQQTTELKTEILKLKNDARDHAVKSGEVKSETEEKIEEKYFEMLEYILMEGAENELPLEEVQEKIEKPTNLMDTVNPSYDEVVLVNGSMMVTEKGRQELRKHLGFEEFDGDPEAEAQKQLKDNPLRYYLDSFNKIHKGDHLLKIWEFTSALSSRCADRQIHSWAVGPSGAGKSHLKRRLLDYLPPTAYERKESFSPKALQYKSKKEGSGFLNNKLVYFDEVGGDDVENAIELMRLMTDQDQDEITHETVKDQEIITIAMDVDAITVWFTSVETVQDEQLKNRFILTNPDSSSAQDQTVNQHQQEILNKGGDLDFVPKEAIVVQRMVKDLRENTSEYKPIVPFKINWKQEFNRRLYPFFYTLMGLIAKIHYKNRVTKDGYIFVTEADFKLAKLIWGELIDTTVAQTDEKSIELLRELPDSRDEAVDRQQLRLRLSGFSTNKVKETCDKLEETEELQLINTDYEEGKYVHWAGKDVEKLVDNEPEIRQFDEDTVKHILQESGVEPDQEILNNVFNAEIPVYNYLKQKLEEKKQQREQGDGFDVEITEEEEEALKQMNEMGWDVDINGLEQMHDGDINFVEKASQLEEKGVIRLDGANMPTPKAKLDELKANNEVIL
jgi:hypothetical protein